MTQESHFQAYTPRKPKLKKTHVSHCSSYCKQCCNEQWDTSVSLILVSSGYMHRSWDTSVSFNFGFLRVYAQEWDCWGKQWFYSQFFFCLFCFVLFFKESPYRLPQWLQQFTFPPEVQEGSLFITPSPALVDCRFFMNTLKFK